MQNYYARCLYFKVAAGLAQRSEERLKHRPHLVEVTLANYSRRWLISQSNNCYPKADPQYRHEPQTL